jgi:hypothetical protein
MLRYPHRKMAAPSANQRERARVSPGAGARAEVFRTKHLHMQRRVGRTGAGANATDPASARRRSESRQGSRQPGGRPDDRVRGQTLVRHRPSDQRKRSSRKAGCHGCSWRGPAVSRPAVTWPLQRRCGHARTAGFDRWFRPIGASRSSRVDGAYGRSASQNPASAGPSACSGSAQTRGATRIGQMPRLSGLA